MGLLSWLTGTIGQMEFVFAGREAVQIASEFPEPDRDIRYKWPLLFVTSGYAKLLFNYGDKGRVMAGELAAELERRLDAGGTVSFRGTLVPAPPTVVAQVSSKTTGRLVLKLGRDGRVTSRLPLQDVEFYAAAALEALPETVAKHHPEIRQAIAQCLRDYMTDICERPGLFEPSLESFNWLNWSGTRAAETALLRYVPFEPST